MKFFGLINPGNPGCRISYSHHLALNSILALRAECELLLGIFEYKEIAKARQLFISGVRFWKAEELADAYNLISRIDTAVMGDQEVSDQLAALLVNQMNPTTPVAHKGYTPIPRAQAASSFYDVLL